jgi:hypothetical protein
MPGPIQWQIEIVDSGQTAEQLAGGAGPATQQAPRADSERIQGPRKRGSDGTGSDLASAADKIFGAFGFGAVAKQAKSLADAFADLFSAVTKNADALRGQATAADIGGGTRDVSLGPKVSRSADSSGEIINPRMQPFGEPPVEIKGPPATGGSHLTDLSAMFPGPKAGGPAGNAARGAAAEAAIAGPAAAAATAGPAAGGTTAAEGMAGLAAKLGPLALAAGAVTVAVIGAAAAANRFGGVLKDQSNKLAQFSGELTGAQAQNDVRSELAMIRRADRVGPGLANASAAAGEIQEKIADINTELLKIAVDILNELKPAVPVVVNGLGVVASGIPVIADSVGSILTAFASGSLEPLKMSAEELANISKLTGKLVKFAEMENEDDDLGEDPAIAAFMSLATGASARTGIPIGPRAENPLVQARRAARQQGKGR